MQAAKTFYEEQTKLSHEQTLPFAERVGVDKDAVYNFLCTRHYASYLDNMANLAMDGRLYRWNQKTIKAIMEGLSL